MIDKFKKSLIILRGLPGSGKSTLSEILCEKGTYPIHSIDDFFTNPLTGEYNFDFKKNHMAYKSCEEKTEQSLKKSFDKVFVDNCFTMDWEIEPYFKLASKYDYNIFIVTVENRHQGKNSHEITTSQLEKMAEKYKVRLLP